MSPAPVKTLRIDGRDLSGRHDETILDVARQNGIFIPRLCEMDGLSDVGACRLCLVEIKGQNKLLPIETLLNVEHGSPYYNEANRASVFYAESWALIHYLMMDDVLARLDKLRQVLLETNKMLGSSDTEPRSADDGAAGQCAA